MLLPSIKLTNFTEDELEIIYPILNHKNVLFSLKPSQIPKASEFIYLAIVKHLFRNIKYMTPYISLNDPFTNPFFNKTISEINQLCYPWTVNSLTLLCAKILGELDGGFSEQIVKQIQNKRNRL